MRRAARQNGFIHGCVSPCLSRLTASLALPLPACVKAPAFSGGQSRLSPCNPTRYERLSRNCPPDVHRLDADQGPQLEQKQRMKGWPIPPLGPHQRHYHDRHFGRQPRNVNAPPRHTPDPHDKLPNKSLNSSFT
eukprot:7289376-Prymnesium_polylepis.1